MAALSPDQVGALNEPRQVCHALDVGLVMIGAAALRVWFPAQQRPTEDLDVVVALDLDDFRKLEMEHHSLG